MRTSRTTVSGWVLAGLLWFAILPVAAQDAQRTDTAQPASPMGKEKKAKKKKSRSWKGSVRVRGDFTYDDNLFLLSGDQKRDLENAGPAEQISGRFRNMTDAAAFIFTPVVEFELQGPGVAGRKLELKAETGYNIYFSNSERNHVELALSAAQATSKNGRTRLRFKLVPDYFQKNYLADATDLTGSVTADERVYLPGRYREWEMMLDYRHRLLGGEDASLAAWIGAGYGRRRYDAPFIGRNRNVPLAAVGIDANVTKRWELDFRYEFAAADSPRTNEVVILDEADFGVDFNGDSDALDIDLRTVQAVDRTHSDQRFLAESQFELTKRLGFGLAYERRRRHYSSQERFDVAHNRRTDDRDVIEAVVLYKLVKGTWLRAGYAYARQQSNRAGDPGLLGEITDFRRNRIVFGLQHRF